MSISHCMERTLEGSGRTQSFPVRLRGTQLYRTAESALPLHARGLRSPLDRSGRAALCLLHQHSAREITPSAFRQQTTTASGITKARHSRSLFVRTSIRPSGSTFCWPRWLRDSSFCILRLRLLRAKREFDAVLAERNRIAREVHDTLAQGYVGVSVQLEVLSELLRNNKTEAAVKHLDTARQNVREGLGGSASVHLGSALARHRRKHAPREAAPHHRASQWKRHGGIVQSLRRLSAHAA